MVCLYGVLFTLCCLDLGSALYHANSVEKVVDGNGALDTYPEKRSLMRDESSGTRYYQMAPDGSFTRTDPSRLGRDGEPLVEVEEVNVGSAVQQVHRANHGSGDPATDTGPLPRLSNVNAASLMLKHVRSRLNASSFIDTDSSKPINNVTLKSGMVWMLFLFLLVGCILSVVIALLSSRSSQSLDDEALSQEAQRDGGPGGSNEDQPPTVEKTFVRKPEGLDEDLYGMGIASLIRDSQRFAMKTELMWLRFGRLAISLLVLGFTMSLQVFLLYEMKHLVTSVSTHEARDAYDKYEIWMYGNNTTTMDVTANGYHRGRDGFFNLSAFNTLDDDTKDNACQMPLSQPSFFIGILLIWTLVCCAEMRHTFELAISLVWATPTISTMAEATVETPDNTDEAVVVVGLTIIVKLIAVFFILIPRLIVSCILLWLGCRWLTGTMGFSDVLQNAVTLEFILLCKDLFYSTMAPHHNKMETRNTLILPHADRERPTISVFLGAFVWGVISITWVLLYIEVFQQVLPEYRWDIHDACSDYLASVEQATPG